jgi:hypothetical protein
VISIGASSKHLDNAGFNKVDEGNVYFGYTDSDDGGKVPYYRGRGIEETGQSFFSPNRQLPSAVMFGSLPTGVMAKTPVADASVPSGSLLGLAPGRFAAPGSLWLDLFHLPIVDRRMHQ